MYKTFSDPPLPTQKVLTSTANGNIAMKMTKKRVKMFKVYGINVFFHRHTPSLKSVRFVVLMLTIMDGPQVNLQIKH